VTNEPADDPLDLIELRRQISPKISERMRAEPPRSSSAKRSAATQIAVEKK
jgi:hypothetical protein